MSTNLTQVLNKQIANWSVLYIKLHNFHWYVKGPQFFTLHTKFEELYNEASLHIDELAEHLLALGGQPVATMKGALELASVQEATGNEADDETTGDMLLAIHSSLEKHAWMLHSFLGK